MLEILLLRYLCGKLSVMMRRKGRKPTGYCVLLCVLWFLGELAAAVLAMVVLGDPDRAMVYLGALAGAAAGAGTAFWIAWSVSSLGAVGPAGFPVIQATPLPVRDETGPL